MISSPLKVIKLFLSIKKSNQNLYQRYKVDLTPYIDEYKFNFDGVFD